MPIIQPLAEAKAAMTVTTQQPSAKLASSQSQIPTATPSTPEVPRETLETPANPAPASQSPKPDPRFTALSKKEQQLRARERELKSLEASFKPWQEAATLAQTNKLEALKRLGISYDDLTNQFLGTEAQLTPEQMAVQKAEEVTKNQLDAFRKEQQDNLQKAQTQAYQQAKQQIAQEAQEIAQPDKFPLVNKIKGFDTVSDYIEQEFHATGKIIPIEAATLEYENFVKNEILELAKLDVIKSEILKLQEPKQTPTQAAVNPQKPQTLTHKQTVAPPSTEPANESYAQKKQRIIQKYWS